MSNVLIVIPAGTEPQQAITTALELAKQRSGRLVALVVLDPDLGRGVTSTLGDAAFVGEQVEAEVGEAILHGYRTDAEAFLKTLVERGGQGGIAVVPLIEEGDTGEVCARVIVTHQIGLALLVAEKRSWLARFLSRRAAVKLPALSGCEVRVMEEQ